MVVLYSRKKTTLPGISVLHLHSIFRACAVSPNSFCLFVFYFSSFVFFIALSLLNTAHSTNHLSYNAFLLHHIENLLDVKKKNKKQINN